MERRSREVYPGDGAPLGSPQSGCGKPNAGNGVLEIERSLHMKKQGKLEIRSLPTLLEQRNALLDEMDALVDKRIPKPDP